MKFLEKVLTFIGVALVFLLFALILAYPTAWLWNSIVVVKFGAPTFTWYEMLGLIVLIRILVPSSNNKKE